MTVSGHIDIQKSKNSNNELSRRATTCLPLRRTCNVTRPRSAQILSAVLRPNAIKQARLQLAEGNIDAGHLREIENEAIRQLVQQQCDCGLHVVTDGEFRRAWWHFDFFDGLEGVERYDSEKGIQFNGVQTKAHGVRVTGKLGFGNHPMLEDFRF